METTTGSSGKTASIHRLPDSSVALGQALRSNNIYFGGENCWEMGNRNSVPKLHAPSGFSQSSSIAHLDSLTYQAGMSNSLMHPAFEYAEAVHSPGEFGLAILKDIGWDVNRLVTFTSPHANQTIVRGDSIELAWTDNQDGPITTVSLLKRNLFGTYELYGTLPSVQSYRGSNPPVKFLIPANADSGSYKISFLDGQLGQGYGATFAFNVTSTAQVERVVLVPPGNTYYGPISVNAQTATQGATVRYDTTGGEPTENSPVYPEGGLELPTSGTIRAKAFKPPLYSPSEVTVEQYNDQCNIGCADGTDPTDETEPGEIR